MIISSRGIIYYIIIYSIIVCIDNTWNTVMGGLKNRIRENTCIVIISTYRSKTVAHRIFNNCFISVLTSAILEDRNLTGCARSCGVDNYMLLYYWPMDRFLYENAYYTKLTGIIYLPARTYPFKLYIYTYIHRV